MFSRILQKAAKQSAGAATVSLRQALQRGTTTIRNFTTTTTQTTGSASGWKRIEEKFFKKFFGVEGGVLLRSARWQALSAKSPTFRTMNNGLYLVLTPLRSELLMFVDFLQLFGLPLR